MADTEITGTKQTITPNQAIFIYHLRQNPNQRRQTYGTLDDECGGMCSLGLGMEAFNIHRTFTQFKKRYPALSLSEYRLGEKFDPYRLIAEKLEVPEDAISGIYKLNDRCDLPFSEVADFFERYLLSDRSASPYEMYIAETSAPKKSFTETWDGYRQHMLDYKAEMAKQLNINPEDIDFEDLDMDSDEAWIVFKKHIV